MSLLGPRAPSSALANPVLVGAVALLVTVVAVFLAYGANNGLPFVPTTQLKVEVPNGANLVRGNEVRSGGQRVGIVERLDPVRLPGGKVGAVLSLKLEKSLGAVPRDSRVTVRPRSALGLKYVELATGRSERTFADGDTLPARQARVPVEIDEVFGTFDRPTREASQGNLESFGDAFAGRGVDLGRTIERLPGLTARLEPVMANLADPETGLQRFFSELATTAATVAPVSDTQARLFTTMADTFAAIGDSPPALRDTIAKTPPTLEVGTPSLRVQRPFLADLAAFSDDLRGASESLRAALPDVNGAVREGIGSQRRAVALNRRLRGTLEAADDLAAAPQTIPALRGLTETTATLNPTVRFLGPFVTVCNSWNYFWTFAAEHFTEQDTVGQSQRALLNSTGRQKSSTGSMGAVEPANGEDVREGNPQFLNAQAYAAAIDDQGRADCESGQRGFLERNAAAAPDRFDISRDPRTPGRQGPNFASDRDRVPPGQTFTARPETGPYTTLPPSEGGER